MKEFFLHLTDFSRRYITEEFMLYFGLVAAGFGTIFMIALFCSILRIHFSIKRDGKNPPALHLLTLFGYSDILSASQIKIKKRLKKEEFKGSGFLLNTALIYPYVKPIDRFIARAWFFFGFLVCVFVVFYRWLY
ncbi:MAG: hypothetical protein ACK4L8_16505 [Nitrincola lacisaponensis]|uniref:hypothetical protein n=1 Tax=Nitrincola lacisaponensis TaxID=267850 RepID=UPI00391DFC20